MSYVDANLELEKHCKQQAHWQLYLDYNLWLHIFDMNPRCFKLAPMCFSISTVEYTTSKGQASTELELTEREKEESPSETN